jgi:hypothetical protein
MMNYEEPYEKIRDKEKGGGERGDFSYFFLFCV